MMSTVEINLDWYRDSKGYQLDTSGRFPNRIVAKGGGFEAIKPLRGPVFAAFANVRSSAHLINFMNLYGYLEATSYEVADPQGNLKLSGERVKIQRKENGEEIWNFPNTVLVGEDVDRHLETAALFKSLIANATGSARPTIARRTNMATFFELVRFETIGEATVVADRYGRFRTVLTPPSLLSGMCIQLVEALQQRSNTRVCALPMCEKVFPVGGTSGKRLVARYCCSQHRINFNSMNRSRRDA